MFTYIIFALGIFLVTFAASALFARSCSKDQEELERTPLKRILIAFMISAVFTIAAIAMGGSIIQAGMDASIYDSLQGFEDTANRTVIFTLDR